LVSSSSRRKDAMAPACSAWVQIWHAVTVSTHSTHTPQETLCVIASAGLQRSQAQQMHIPMGSDPAQETAPCLAVFAQQWIYPYWLRSLREHS
jgi:hypothetical protein